MGEELALLRELHAIDTRRAQINFLLNELNTGYTSTEELERQLAHVDDNLNRARRTVVEIDRVRHDLLRVLEMRRESQDGEV